LTFFRDVELKTWHHTAKQLGYGTEGGAYAREDDGNPAWEDVEDESDCEAIHEQETRWREDEAQNGDTIFTLSTATLQDGQGCFQKGIKVRDN